MGFTQKMVEVGTLIWRSHKQTIDVVVMNDVDVSTGIFQMNKFVHVWMHHDAETTRYTCDCSMYGILINVNDADEVCCHIRFLKEHVEANIHSLFNSDSDTLKTAIGVMLKRSIASIGQPVVKLDQHKLNHKFSVFSDDQIASVIVTLEKNRFVCTNGECRALKSHKRKAVSLDDSASLCQHLRTLNQNKAPWKEFVTELLEDDNTNIPVTDVPEEPLHCKIVSNDIEH